MSWRVRLIGGSQDGRELVIEAATPLIVSGTPWRREYYRRSRFTRVPPGEPIEYRYLGPLKPSGAPA